MVQLVTGKLEPPLLNANSIVSKLVEIKTLMCV